jgi:hypothetical protein
MCVRDVKSINRLDSITRCYSLASVADFCPLSQYMVDVLVAKGTFVFLVLKHMARRRRHYFDTLRTFVV